MMVGRWGGTFLSPREKDNFDLEGEMILVERVEPDYWSESTTP